jgi:hypothetical protein
MNAKISEDIRLCHLYSTLKCHVHEPPYQKFIL